MRRTTLFSLFLLAAPAALAAQVQTTVAREEQTNRFYFDTHRLALLPNETVGFRVLGSAAEARTMRVTTGHLLAGPLYRAVAVMIPRNGGPALQAEGTISTDTPTLSLGVLPAGAYVITMHLEDLATDATRDAKSSVILR